MSIQLREKGYPKLKKYLSKNEGMKEFTIGLLNMSEENLESILRGNGGIEFTFKQALIICWYLNINLEEYFF